MPNCDFYALDEDFALILDFVFRQDGWELHELSSAPDHLVRVFRSTREVLEGCDVGRSSVCLQLYSPEMAGRPLHRRIEFTPGTVPGATHRFSTEGWGLVQLYFGFLRNGEGLTHSQTNHNSAVRARKWAPHGSALGSPEEWDWAGVGRVSGRLVRFIQRHRVVKHGTRPVLPGAHRAVQAGARLLLNP